MQYIKISVQNHVGVVTLSNPPVNVLTFDVLDELSNAFDDLATNDDIWAMVLNSDQKIFSAGADVKNLEKADEKGNYETSKKMQSVFLKIENFPHPVICAVHGNCLGGGLELALSCDLRVFDEAVKVGLPECGLGITPGAGGTQRLTKLIGAGRAKRLIFTGELITAQEALNLGICEYVAPNTTVLDKAVEIATVIASKAPKAVSTAKKCIDFACENSLQDGLEFENVNNSKLFNTEDRLEGIHAMFEKRKPEFNNK